MTITSVLFCIIWCMIFAYFGFRSSCNPQQLHVFIKCVCSFVVNQSVKSKPAGLSWFRSLRSSDLWYVLQLSKVSRNTHTYTHTHIYAHKYIRTYIHAIHLSLWLNGVKQQQKLWIFQFDISFIYVLFVENLLLVDLGAILNIQLADDNGTYVANNSMLCFDADVAWARHSMSYIEFNRTTVSEN